MQREGDRGPRAASGLPDRIPVLDSREARIRALAVVLPVFLLIAAVDRSLEEQLSLGFLYLFPILVLALFASRAWLVFAAIACSVLREAFSVAPWADDVLPRMAMGALAFLGTALFVSELARNRRRAMEHATELQQQVALRETAQGDLQALVDSSPAAIFTLDGSGRVLLANSAAHDLLGFPTGTLSGAGIAEHLPALASALEHPGSPLRTSMECIGRRRGGDVFFAHVWFSTYGTPAGLRLAAIALDASEQLRDREELGLGTVAAASRVLFAAVSHEVRNLAASAAVAHANLARTAGLRENADFVALGSLVEGLRQLAAAELRLGASPPVDAIELGQVLDELRIVLAPALREHGIELDWRVERELPAVLADRQGLLQIFLNLGQNAQRELAARPIRRLAVDAEVEPDHVRLRFEDTGPGVAHPESLFRPFFSGGPRTGLGLFISRTLARSFAGDLLYEPVPGGSRFVVRLARSGSTAEDP